MKAFGRGTTIEGDKDIEIATNSLKSTEEINLNSKALLLLSIPTAMGLTCPTTVLLFNKKTIPTCSLQPTANLDNSTLPILFNPTLLTLLPILQLLV